MQAGAAATAQIVDANVVKACHPGACRHDVQAHLNARIESILSDPAISSSCSSPRIVHDIVMTACADELVNDVSLGCTCTDRCTKSIGKVLSQPFLWISVRSIHQKDLSAKNLSVCCIINT